jgi:hypothetical protein
MIKTGSKRPTFEQAKAQYVHRYTMEHIPSWARRRPHGADWYYAPQYRTDREWYDNTKFPGEKGHPDYPGSSNHCYTTNQSWPLGQKLTKPYQYGQSE